LNNTTIFRANNYPVVIIISLSVILLTGFFIGSGFLKPTFLILAGLIVAIVSAMGGPTFVLGILYPILHPIGQYPIVIEEISISLERFVLIICAFIFFGFIFNRNRKLPSLPKKILAPIFLWLVSSLVSGIFNQGSDWFVIFAFLQKLFFCWFVFLALSERNTLIKALNVYVITSFIASIFTVFLFFRSDTMNIIRNANFLSGESLSEGLLFGIARAGSGDMMAIWIALLFFKQNDNQNIKKTIWAGIAIWLVGVSMLSLRREYIIDIIIGIVFIVFYKPIQMRKQGAFIGLAMMVILSSVLLTSPEWQRRLFTETTLTVQNQNDLRTLALRRSITAFIQRPLLGYGPGSYEYVIPAQPGNDLISSREEFRAHNSFASVAVETGLFGLVGLGIFLGVIAADLHRKTMRQTPALEQDFIPAFAMLFLLQILLSISFGNGLIINLIWFWIGIVVSIGFGKNSVLEKSR